MNTLFQRLGTSLRYGTLDYKHITRDFLSSLEDSPELKAQVTEEMRDFLLPLATSGFDYYANNKKVFESDISLRTVTSLCSFKDLMLNVKAEDKTVHFLSHLFNQVIHSTRGLYECYDCGTNARAMFMHLVEAHRGKLYISPQEQIRMQEMYSPNSEDPVQEAERCRTMLKKLKKDTVFICSIGLGDSGHVWVFEKRFINGKERYHMYQSSLNSHLVLDFIENRKYADNPHQSLDVDQFFDEFKIILEHNGPWDERIKNLFAKLFAFLPGYDVMEHENSFCWTYLTY